MIHSTSNWSYDGADWMVVTGGPQLTTTNDPKISVAKRDGC